MSKKVISAISTRIKSSFVWLEKQIVSSAEHIAEDSRSLRVLLNWVYCIFYLWLVWYGVTHYKDCITTAIISTSTLVGAIFTGYVFTKSYEKVRMKESNAYEKKGGNKKPTLEEREASD